MDFMAGLTRHFLDAIQPNDLSFSRTAEFLDTLSEGDAVRALLRYELLWYEVGFLLCAVVAILYMVSMPVIGGILACCRYRGKCGGGTLPTSRTATYRRALYWSVVIVTGMVLLGNTYMFMSTKAWGVDQINGTLNSLQSYFTAVPEQFDHMMDESYRTVEEINRIGPKLGEQIKNSLQTGLSSALESVGSMKDLSHGNARKDLETFNKRLGRLKRSAESFKRVVTEARGNLSSAMVRIKGINFNLYETLNSYHDELDFSEILRFGWINQSLSGFQSAVDEVKWDSLLHKVNDYLETIPLKVTNDTKEVVQPMRNTVEDTKTHISEATSDILASVSTNVTNTLQQLQRNINKITPSVERAERISRAVGVVLCCLVLLVVGCNVLGLVLGPLGPDPKAVVIVRSSTGHYGGNSLLVSAGVIFLSSWLLMGAVLLLFVPGWSMYALVCKPWQDGELLKIIDTPRLFGFELGSMLGLDRNLTLTEVYTDCQKNMSLWFTLYIHDLINPEEPLNVSQYTDVILSKVNITPIALLSPVESQIINLHEKAKDINFTAFTQNVSRILSGQLSSKLNTTKTNLHTIIEGLRPAPDLDEDDDEDDDGLVNDLEDAFDNLDSAFRQLERTSIQNRIRNLNSTEEKLQSNVNEINAKVSKVLREVGAAQAFLDDNNTMPTILAEHRAFVDRQLDNVAVKHVEWTNLTQKVARCGPVATAVDSAEKIICRNMVESLNVFWFSLALCLIFFIPSVIFSIRLAKYYRRMEPSDRPRDDYLSQELQETRGWRRLIGQ